jgi:hypothetical protein
MTSGVWDNVSHEYTCFIRRGEDARLHGRFLYSSRRPCVNMVVYQDALYPALSRVHAFAKLVAPVLAFAGNFCERTYAHGTIGGLFSQKVGVLRR